MGKVVLSNVHDLMPPNALRRYLEVTKDMPWMRQALNWTEGRRFHPEGLWATEFTIELGDNDKVYIWWPDDPGEFALKFDARRPQVLQALQVVMPYNKAFKYNNKFETNHEMMVLLCLIWPGFDEVITFPPRN